MSDDLDNNTVITDPLIPVDTDKSPIEWDGNVATLAGILYEIERF